MNKINRFLFTIIYFVLLINNTKQSRIKQTKMTLKVIGNTLKKPTMKTVSNAIKSSIGMFNRKKNNIKNFAFGLEKEGKKQFRSKHNVGIRFVQNLGREGVSKYKLPQIIKEGKKNTQLRSARQMGGNGLRSLINGSAELMKRKELISLINMISINKITIPFLGLGSLIGQTKLNLASELKSGSDNLSDSDVTPYTNKEKMKTVSSSGFTEMEKVITSSFDKREYSFGKLDNDMSVQLISDKDTEKSAAAITMGVGSLDEPEEFPGLAHFFEHVLFLGSKKYPKALDYDEFFTVNGGSNNAYTDDHKTVYSFDCSNNNFKEALERTSANFKHPLFDDKYTEKEKSAVISEYIGYQQDDTWRKISVLNNVSNPKSFIDRFSVGNEETLSKPGFKQALKDFYTKYCSSNLLFACLYNNQPIEKMKEYAIELLGDIENKKAESPSYTDSPKPYGPEELKKQVIFEKVDDGQEMSIYFSLPYYPPEVDASLNYIFNAIEHQGKGSVYQELSEKGWLLDLDTGYEIKGKNNSVWSNIELVLTEEGFQNYEKVASAVMSYIEMLRTTEPQKWLYDEFKLMDEQDFRYSRKSQPYDTVEEIAGGFGIHQNQHLLNHDYHYSKFDPELIKEQLGYMTFENSLILLCAENIDFVNNDYKVDKYFPVKFKSYDYNEKLQSLLSKDFYKPAIPFSQPSSNYYIAKNFDLQSETDPSLKGVDKVDPVLILSEKGCDIWYKPDVTFKEPRVVSIFQIYKENDTKSLTSQESIYSQIWIGLLMKALKEETSQAELAGCEIKLGMEEDGIDLIISSFNDSIMPFTTKVGEKIASFKEEFDEADFETVKTDTKESLISSFYKNPLLQAYHYQDSMLNPKISPFSQKRLKSYDKITFEGYKNYCRNKIWSKLFFQAQFTGNITKESSIEVYTKLKDSLNSYKNFEPLEKKNIIQFPILKLTKNETSIYSKFLKNEDDKNSATLKYYQLDPCEGDKETRIKESFSMRLLNQFLDDKFYTELRTEQQLGYTVYCTETRKRGVLGITFAVRGYVKDPNYISERISEFLESHQTKLEELPEEDFEKLKTGQLEAVSKKALNLPEESGVLWFTQIYSHSYNWDYIEKKKAAVAVITKDDTIKLYKKLFLGEQKVLEVHMVSKDIKKEYKEALAKRTYKKLKDGDVLDSYADLYAYRETYEKLEQYNDI